jgi:hypothetical protein
MWHFPAARIPAEVRRIVRSRAAIGAVGVPANSEHTGPSKSISK